MAICYLLAVYFSVEKDIHTFGIFIFFGLNSCVFGHKWERKVTKAVSATQLSDNTDQRCVLVK